MQTSLPALHHHPIEGRLTRSLLILLAVLALSTFVALWAGYQRLDIAALRYDDAARAVFFRLRLPRVVMAALVGSTLAAVGAALQALFRNPLADPFTLGVSGGGALGASIAIALGWGIRVAGVPVIFITAFAGSAMAIFVVYRIARTGAVVLPGALLLAGVVSNLIASAGAAQCSICGRSIAGAPDSTVVDRQSGCCRLSNHRQNADISYSRLDCLAGIQPRSAPAGGG